MRPFYEAFAIFMGVVIIGTVIMTVMGCTPQKPRPCVKAQIQIADMTNQYQKCKGLPYE